MHAGRCASTARRASSCARRSAPTGPVLREVEDWRHAGGLGDAPHPGCARPLRRAGQPARAPSGPPRIWSGSDTGASRSWAACAAWWCRRSARPATRRALAAAGLPLDPELVFESPPTREGGEAALGRALALADPPTAALCFNDVVAIGVLHGLGRRGLEVGRDFALVGFDDVADARAAVPPLTTVAVDPPRLGERAAQILLRSGAGPGGGPGQHSRRGAARGPRVLRRHRAEAREWHDVSRTGWGLIGASTIAQRAHDRRHPRATGGEVVAVMSSRRRRAASAYAAENGIARSYDAARRAAGRSGRRRGLHQHHQRAAPRADARGRQGRQACPVREAAGADPRRRARAWSRPAATAGVVMGTNHHLRNAAHAPRDARGDRRPGGSASRCSPRVFHAVYLPPHLQGWRIDRPEAGGGVVLDITVHDADTLRFVLGDEPVEVVAHDPERGHGQGRARGRRRWRVVRFRSGLLAQFHDAFTVTLSPAPASRSTAPRARWSAGTCMTPAPDRRGRAAHRGRRARRCRSTHENLYERALRRLPRRDPRARASRPRRARTACARWRVGARSARSARRPAPGDASIAVSESSDRWPAKVMLRRRGRRP